MYSAATSGDVREFVNSFVRFSDLQKKFDRKVIEGGESESGVIFTINSNYVRFTNMHVVIFTTTRYVKFTRGNRGWGVRI